MFEGSVESIVVYYNDSEELPRAEYFNNRADCREFIKTSFGCSNFDVRNFRTDERIDVDNEPVNLRFKVTFEQGYDGPGGMWSEKFFNTLQECMDFIVKVRKKQCRYFTVYDNHWTGNHTEIVMREQ